VLTGEGRFDVSTATIFKFRLADKNVKSIVIEFAPDGNGNSSGTLAVYLGEAIGGLPWRIVSAKTLRVYPSPECDFVSVIPSAGAKGLCIISLSQDSLGVGIFPFESSGGGGGGGVPPSLVQHSPLARVWNGENVCTATLPAEATDGNLIVILGTGYRAASPPAGFMSAIAVNVGYEGGNIFVKVAQGEASPSYAVTNVQAPHNMLIYEVANWHSFVAAAPPPQVLGAETTGTTGIAPSNSLILGVIEEDGATPWTIGSPFIADNAPPTAANHWAQFMHSAFASAANYQMALTFAGNWDVNNIFILTLIVS
jgi:hypothetical protein